METTKDYLPNTNIYLKQRKDMFRMNTDTALLGQFMKVKPNESVLDIGTNNGALLLYASQYTKGKLIGVELQKEAIMLAEENLKDNHIVNYELICSDIVNVEIDAVDVIVCNPPYFQVHQNRQLNENEFKRIARHECYLKLSDLCACASRLLKEKGRFYLVHRADRIVDLCVELRKQDLEIKTLQMICDEQNENAHGILIEAVKQAKAHCIVKKEMTVKQL